MTNQKGLLLKSHSDQVVTLAALPNGDLASGSNDKLIKIWNTTSGDTKNNLTDHQNSVNCLVLLKNSDLASGSSDFTVKVWDINSWFVKKNLNTGSIVWSLAELQNGNLAIGCDDGRIIIWDISNNTTLNLTGQAANPVTSLVFLNGDLIAGYYNGSIQVFSIPNQQLKYNLNSHTSRVSSLVVLPIGYLASGSYDGKVKIHNVTENKLITDITVTNVTSLAVLSNDDLVEGSSNGHNAISYSISSSSYTNGLTFVVDNNHLILSLAVLQNGKLACGLEDGTIQLFS